MLLTLLCRQLTLVTVCAAFLDVNKSFHSLDHCILLGTSRNSHYTLSLQCITHNDDYNNTDNTIITNNKLIF